MYLINEQISIDITPWVDLSELLSLKPYLDYAVVKSSRLATPSRYAKFQFLDQTYPGIQNVIDQGCEYHFIKDLEENDQIASWLRYQFDVVYGQQSVQIYYPKDWKTKHLESEVATTEAAVYWDKFFVWLKNQHVFQEYGRVVVFLNEPGVNTPIHFDSNNPTPQDEFIWINLDNRKRMFVYDPELKVKHYLSTPIGTFHNSNYHGADAGELASWSLRVDGIFSDEFLKKSGLYQHYR